MKGKREKDEVRVKREALRAVLEQCKRALESLMSDDVGGDSDNEDDPDRDPRERSSWETVCKNDLWEVENDGLEQQGYVLVRQEDIPGFKITEFAKKIPENNRQGGENKVCIISEASSEADISDISRVRDTPQRVETETETATQDNGEPPMADNGEPGVLNLSRRSTTKEVIEQIEPGVYVSFIQHSSGINVFKRIRFSKRKFIEQKAEEWWRENRDRVLKKYPPPTLALPTTAPIDVESNETSTPA